MITFFVPEGLREQAPFHGVEGIRWLDHLPAQVAELEQEWSLTAGRGFDHGGCVSWVAPVRLEDGTDAVLKIGIPHREARDEAAALRVFDGHGAVRLLRVSEDGFSLLLERCLPGEYLGSLGEDAADAAGAAVLQQLWREPPFQSHFESLPELAAEWCESLPRTAPAEGYDTVLVHHAIEMARELAATQPRKVLLHGDYHPANVLSAAREPWLAIDCKPLVGDPAYDLAQWLGNRCEAALQSAGPVAALRRQIDRFGSMLGLDPARIAGWAFVKSLGWDWGPTNARLLCDVADG